MPQDTPPPDAVAPELQAAIRRAADRLLQDQDASGAWLYGNPMGPRTTALTAVVYRFLGWKLPRAEASLAWIESWQDEDGSFPAHIRADEGGVAMTATCLAGLAALGRGPGDASYDGALAYLQRGRGLDAVDPGTRMLLAIVGVLDPDQLDPNHVFYFVTPRVLRPLAKRFNPGAIMFMMALGAVTIEVHHRVHGKARGLTWARASHTIRAFLLELHSENGSWFDLPIATNWYLLALHAAGMPSNHPSMLRARSFLEGRLVQTPEGQYLVGMDSQVWNTGLALRAVCRAGVPELDEQCQQAAHALRQMQILSPPTPLIFQPRPDAPREGGWAFTVANPLQADTDDTGVALAGLAQLHRAGLHDDELVRSINLGVEWLLAMQNDDGGWAAFATGLPSKKPGALDATKLMNPPRSLIDKFKLFMEKPPEMGDPSTAGLTGRVLLALGELGFDAADPAIEEAIAFLQHQQDLEVGGWWGMWMVNWLPATACVLQGLASVHADLEQPWVQAAIAFLERHQNEDGGWGELSESYLDRSQIGVGPSMPALTGLVTQALYAVGRGDTEGCRKAIEYLLATQDEDGGWTDEQWLQIVLFPDTLYFNGAHPHVFPLEALCAHRDHLLGHDAAARLEGRHQQRGPALWTDAYLDQMRQRTDPEADAAVAALFAEGVDEVEEVSALFKSFAESDDPIPAALPDPIEAFFYDTGHPSAYPPDGRKSHWPQAPACERVDTIDADMQRFGNTTFSYSCLPMIASLFTASLPEAYLAADGALVLTETGRLERDIDRRILETARFILAVMDPEGMKPDGLAIRTAQKIRLIHACVRWLITRHHPDWDQRGVGRPINQEDLAGTLMTFSILVTEAMRRMRIELTVDQQEAYLYAWRVLAHFLGVDRSLWPESTVEARILMTRIRRRHHRRSEQGQELMEALLRGMSNNVPAFVPDELPAAMVRHVIGNTRADLLGIPATPKWSTRLQRLMRAADREGWFSGKPPRGDTSSSRGRRKMSALGRFNIAFVRWVLRRKAKGSPLPFELPTRLEGHDHPHHPPHPH